jgi:UDP-N-acetylglucosamine acyltransferase
MALVDKKAQIDSTAQIDPYAIIDGPVQIGPGTHVYPNAYISGWVEIGQDCEIHPGAVIGHLPQDFHFEPCRSYCRIGDRTVVREFASIHRGTQPESATVIGKGCLIMGYSHIGHNCTLGDNAKLYNMSALSGHVEVGEHAIISGHSGVHQFVRIGRYVMIGGASRAIKDVPPFFMGLGEHECVGVNLVGMRRAGFSSEQIADARQAYRVLYRSGAAFSNAVAQLAEIVSTNVGRQILEFVSSPSKRGFATRPQRNRQQRQQENQEGGSTELPHAADSSES